MASGPRPSSGDVGEQGFCRIERGDNGRPFRWVSRQQRVHRLTQGCEPTRKRAQHVQRKDIRGAFPDRVHLRVAQQLRQSGVFDVPGAAEAFERFGDDADRYLRRPQFCQGRQQALPVVRQLLKGGIER